MCICRSTSSSSALAECGVPGAALIARYDALLPPSGWPNWVLGNHDRSRVASRLWAARRARKPVAMLLLTPCAERRRFYYGDELGMTDVAIPPERVQDPWEKRVPGFDWAATWCARRCSWDASTDGGSHDRTAVVAAQCRYPRCQCRERTRRRAETLTLYRDLLRLAAARLALSVGRYAAIEHRDNLLVFERAVENRRVMVVLNSRHHRDLYAGAALARAALDRILRADTTTPANSCACNLTKA